MLIKASDAPPARGLLTFLAGCTTGAVLCTAAALLLRRKQRSKAAPLPSTKASAAEARELMTEQLSRNVQFLGEGGQRALEDSFVVVVGLGGVGSHAAQLLVRAGVRRVRLIDFDQVSLSSLNRHAVATRKDVGLPKATVLRHHLLETVGGHCNIDARVAMFTASAANELLEGSPDYVIDAIDDTNTKVELLAHCLRHNLRVLSSMGAGAKSDPTRMHIASLADVSNDPLAAKLRWRLRKAVGQNAQGQIEVVYSSEKPHMKLLPLSEEQSERGADNFGAVENFRVRIMPVLGTMPALFGMAMAARVATNLAGRTFEPQPCPSLSHNVLHKMLQRLVTRERKWYGDTENVPLVGEDDVAFLVCDLWRRKCGVTLSKMGGSKRLDLCRFRHDRPASPSNLVLVQSKYADQLCALGKAGKLPSEADEGELGIPIERLQCMASKLAALGQW